MHSREPCRQIAVASEGEPGAGCIIDAAIGRGYRREDRSPEQQEFQDRTSRHLGGVPEGIVSDAKIFPWQQAGADIPGECRGDQQRDDAGHCAIGQRTGGRAHFFGRLRRALDAQIIPDGELEGSDDADPAIGQGILRRDQLIELEHRSLAPRLHREEQDDDRNISKRGDDEIDIEGHQHAAIVEPSEDHDDERNEAIMRQSLGSGPGNDRIASQNGVGYFEHCIGKDQEQGDIEGHQRADNVLGLRILPAGGRDRRGHFRIDHGDGRIEQSDEPAGHESGESAAPVVRATPVTPEAAERSSGFTTAMV